MDHLQVIISTVIILDKNAVYWQFIVLLNVKKFHMIQGVSHIKHYYLISNPYSNSLYELTDQLIQLLPLFLEEIIRCVPNNSIKSFLANHLFDQVNSLLKFRGIAANCLKKLKITSFNINPRNQFDILIGFFNIFGISFIIILLILENGLIFFTDFECIPARTYIVNFMRIFESILKALFIPRSQKDKFLETWEVFLLIIKLYIVKQH